jgi:hypothetical protein
MIPSTFRSTLNTPLSLARWKLKRRPIQFRGVFRSHHRAPTLKSLDLKGFGSRTLIHDDDLQMAALLKKNYGLERLPKFYRKDLAEDVSAVLRLNEAGRRYLVQNGS